MLRAQLDTAYKGLEFRNLQFQNRTLECSSCLHSRNHKIVERLLGMESDSYEHTDLGEADGQAASQLNPEQLLVVRKLLGDMLVLFQQARQEWEKLRP